MPIKTKFIHTVYHVTCLLLLTALSLSSCSDDLKIIGNETVETGLPATVAVRLETGEMKVLTRADMQNGLDKRLSSLWIAVYNAETGVRTGIYKTDNPEQSLSHDNKSIILNTFSGKSYIVGVANYNYRYASTDDDGTLISLEEALDEADTWEKYRSISAAFDSEGGVSVETPLNPLVMSGTYYPSKHADGGYTHVESVDILPGQSELSGAIHLRRLISHIKFNVSYNKDNISSFRIKSWKVVNLPSHSWLSEREVQESMNAPDIRPASDSYYAETPENIDISTSDDTYSFDFWQLENKRTGLEPPLSATTATEAYVYREKEHKTAEGLNTGKYASLVESAESSSPNNNATYVVIRVAMEMKVDENGNKLQTKMRLVETDYVVHLGFVEGNGKDKAKDFNCRRNSRYTYNVKLNNIKDVYVEATSDNEAGEKNPAVEGLITDLTDKYFEVDAHYSAINIYLTEENLRSFEYYVSAYDLNGAPVNINSYIPQTVPAQNNERFMYMDWIEFRKLNSKNSPDNEPKTLAEYKPKTGTNADGKTYTLDEIKQLGKDNKLDAGWYTMFINEYVYENLDNEKNSGAWKGYVNRPDRRVWLYVHVQTSPDANSIYYSSKYAVSQASIQTYYNGLSESGLGVEHINESYGLTLRNSFNPRFTASGSEQTNDNRPGRNKLAGRFNLAQYISNATGKSLSWENDKYSWSDFVDMTALQTINKINNIQGVTEPGKTVNLPEIKTKNITEYNLSEAMIKLEPDYGASQRKIIEAITACLNRNRDNDGDGKIDASELRWFVPTSAQYIRLILGRQSLTHPIFDPGKMTRLPNSTGERNDENSSLLAYASDGRQMWLMEGTSDSEYRQWISNADNRMATPWIVRCVRNLGADNTQILDSAANTPAFELREGTNIVDLKYYDSKSIRSEAYLSSDNPMPVHHINDQRYNRCYRSFEFADSVLPLNDARLELSGKTIEWSDYLSKNNPCSVLDTKTKKGWRVPNQKELTIIGILGKGNHNGMGSTFQVSCSYSYFDFNGYTPGSNPNDPEKGGTISSAYRFPMKIVTSSGFSTQSEKMNNITITNGRYGIRCVRDVN